MSETQQKRKSPGRVVNIKNSREGKRGVAAAAIMSTNRFRRSTTAKKTAASKRKTRSSPSLSFKLPSQRVKIVASAVDINSKDCRSISSSSSRYSTRSRSSKASTTTYKPTRGSNKSSKSSKTTITKAKKKESSKKSSSRINTSSSSSSDGLEASALVLSSSSSQSPSTTVTLESSSSSSSFYESVNSSSSIIIDNDLAAVVVPNSARINLRSRSRQIGEVLSRNCSVRLQRLPIRDRSGTFRVTDGDCYEHLTALSRLRDQKLHKATDELNVTTTITCPSSRFVRKKKPTRDENDDAALSNKIPKLRIERLAEEEVSKLTQNRTRSVKQPEAAKMVTTARTTEKGTPSRPRLILSNMQVSHLNESVQNPPSNVLVEKTKNNDKKNENYALTDEECDEESDENDEAEESGAERNGKHIPLWARKPIIVTRSVQQYLSSLNLTRLFRSAAVKLPLDLSDVLK